MANAAAARRGVACLVALASVRAALASETFWHPFGDRADAIDVQRDRVIARRTGVPGDLVDQVSDEATRWVLAHHRGESKAELVARVEKLLQPPSLLGEAGLVRREDLAPQVYWRGVGDEAERIELRDDRVRARLRVPIHQAMEALKNGVAAGLLARYPDDTPEQRAARIAAALGNEPESDAPVPAPAEGSWGRRPSAEANPWRLPGDPEAEIQARATEKYAARPAVRATYVRAEREAVQELELGPPPGVPEAAFRQALEHAGDRVGYQDRLRRVKDELRQRYARPERGRKSLLGDLFR